MEPRSIESTPTPRSCPTPIAVSGADLPLSCPRPGDELWNMHPRVYLPIADAPDGQVVCPYCGALYRLVAELPGVAR